MDKLYSSPVFTLIENDSIHDALVMMKSNFIKRIVVVKDKKAVGIVTERDINAFLEQDTTSRTLDEIRLKEIMKKDVITISAGQQDHLSQCATRMDTFKIGSIVVVDEQGEVVGITTQTDINRNYAKLYPGKYKVRDYMTDKVVSCRESDSLEFALDIINNNKTSRLVVTDNKGNVKGIITTNDFLKHSEYFKKTQSKIRDYLLPKGTSKDIKVGELIKYEVLIVEPDDDLATVADLMVKNNVSGVPVIVLKNNKLSGIITKADIVRAFSQVITHGKLLENYKTFR
ncbi:MAG: CBS domain-containing protein [Candidatus Nitrosotenuis sp.]